MRITPRQANSDGPPRHHAVVLEARVVSGSGGGPDKTILASAAASPGGRRGKLVRPGFVEFRDVARVDLRQRRKSRPGEIVVVGLPLLRRSRLFLLCARCDCDYDNGERR